MFGSFLFGKIKVSRWVRRAPKNPEPVQMQLTQETRPEIDVSYQQIATDSAVYPMLMGTPLNFVFSASDWTDVAPSTRGIFSEVTPETERER
jgi:hypothetical protein